MALADDSPSRGAAATSHAACSRKAASGGGGRSLALLGRCGVLLLTSLAAGLLCLAALAAVASAAQGDLDPSFGDDGKVASDLDAGRREEARGVAVQGDGKVVAVGRSIGALESQRGMLVRYEEDGSLDQGFGEEGKVAPLVITANEVALQPDGKIVVAGQDMDPFISDGFRFALARYNADGSLDTSFGASGKAVSEFPRPLPQGQGTLETAAEDVAIGPGGKIVGAGYAMATLFGTRSHAVAIARFTPEGQPDLTFGSQGKQTVGVARDAYQGFDDVGLELQPDGRSVIAAKSLRPNFSQTDFFLARFTTLGRLDSSFGGDGVVTTNFGMLSDGLARADGAKDLALQPNGKIVAAGFSGQTDAEGVEDPLRDFAVARYNPDGSLDTSFGEDGMVLTDVGGGGRDSAEGVALQADGKIVAAGGDPSEPAHEPLLYLRGDFVLFRYLGDGSLDPAFGDSGKVTTSFGPYFDGARDLAIQPADGRIVAAGSMGLEGSDGDFSDFALARYEGQPPAPPGSANPSPATGGGTSSVAPPPPAGAAFAGCPPLSANVIRGSAAGGSITGTLAGDRIFGGTGNDVVDGLAGNDCIDLGPGTDRGQGGLGNDLMLGGLGEDRIDGSSGNDRLRGGPSADRLNGGFGDDRLHGQSGKDRISGSRGRDRINGGSANDVISAGSSGDRVAGDQGADRINGNSGNDSLSGNSGNDRITGSTGADRISGGSGGDRINSRDGRRDRVNCGRGRDSVVADRSDRVARNCERVRRA